MKTEVVNVRQEEGYVDSIRRAARLLEQGGLVAFPTETVYGIGANAADPTAIDRLRNLKERPEAKPFTLHIPGRSRLEWYVPSLSGTARRLVNKAWPGPLTVVFPVERPEAAPIASRLPAGRTDLLYHERTIGVRCPDDSVAVDLLASTDAPVVAASANAAGNPAPVNADEVLAELDGRIDLVLDGGTTRYARASTVVRVTEDGCEVLREGVYDERMIRRFLSVSYLFVCTGNTCRSPMAAALCRRLLAEKLGVTVEGLEKRGYTVHSAGVFARAGGRVSEGAVSALLSLGIDLSAHRTQPLTVEQVHAADRVFAMCREHRDAVVRMVPSAAEKTVLLDAEGDIDDPIGAGDDVYRACASRIESALRRRLEETPI